MKSLYVVTMAIALATAAQAQTYTFSSIYAFSQLPDGSADSPGSLIIDSSGSMYTSACCNDSGTDFGSLIKVTPAGVVTTLYTFTGGQDGGGPGNVIRDSDGNLYGMTGSGGAHGSGTVFKLTTSLKETTLYNFNNIHPLGPLLRDSAGNLYGYVLVGSGNHQRIFKLTPKGVYSTIYTFCSQTNCADGANPVGNPIMDKSGNFYGMTNTGGTFGYGVVFKMTPKFKYSVLYSFTGGTDGGNPTGKLTQNPSGLMYGTAFYGGETNDLCFGGCGTVFQISESGVFSVVYTFTDNITDGANPIGTLTLDSPGNLYGVTDDTSTGGDYYSKTFMISPNGVLTALPSTPAEIPGLVVDKSGNVFGTTYNLYFDGVPSIYKLIKD